MKEGLVKLVKEIRRLVLEAIAICAIAYIVINAQQYGVDTMFKLIAVSAISGIAGYELKLLKEVLTVKVKRRRRR